MAEPFLKRKISPRQAIGVLAIVGGMLFWLNEGLVSLTFPWISTAVIIVGILLLFLNETKNNSKVPQRLPSRVFSSHFLKKIKPLLRNPKVWFIAVAVLVVLGTWYFGWYMSERQVRSRCWNSARAYYNEVVQAYNRCLLENGFSSYEVIK